MEIKNAVITDMNIRFFDQNALVLVAVVMFNMGVSHPPRQEIIELSRGCPVKDFVGHWLCKMLLVAGANSVQEIVGKAVRLKIDQDQVEGVGHIVEDAWFNFYGLVEKESTANAEQ